jgi:hypothetical protein
MKCFAVTQNRASQFRRKPHPCECNAVRDGLCKVHLKQRDSLPRQIVRVERELAELHALSELLNGPAAPENPS